MENPVIIIGVKELGMTALDIFQSNDNIVYGFLDDDASLHGKDVNFIPILGSTEDETFLKLLGKSCDAFISLTNNKQRKFFTDLLIEDKKLMPVNAIHSKTFISSFSQMGHGNMIGMGTAIGANVKIGNHCLINSNVTIDHDTVVEDFVQIGSGAVIGSGVTLEEGSFVGAGANIIAGVRIGKSARVGAGSVLMDSIKARQVVFGVPAQEVKN